MTHSLDEHVRFCHCVDQWFARGRAALLEEVTCRRGCHHCCIGPFTITLNDAELLLKGLGTLNPDIRNDIQTQATRQAAIIENEFIRVASSPMLDDWSESDIETLVSRFADLPCPSLGPDGSCRLYAYRPVICRTMGLPVQAGDLVQGACDVQTAVPIVPMPRSLREEEDRLVRTESAILASSRGSNNKTGEEMLLPYGFLLNRNSEQEL